MNIDSHQHFWRINDTDYVWMTDEYASLRRDFLPDDQFILRPDFNAGVKALGRYPLCYDLLIFERHLPPTITFVDQHPEIPMVVDHIAKPVIRRDTFDDAWSTNIRDLARRDNVTCKLSGMVTEVRDPDWDEPLLRPYFETVLEAFGADRLMFGSDWPVCTIRSAHTTWVETARSLIAPLSPSEQEAIMGVRLNACTFRAKDKNPK